MRWADCERAGGGQFVLPRPGTRALDGFVDELVDKPVVLVSEDDLRKNLTNPARTPTPDAWGAEAKVRCGLFCAAPLQLAAPRAQPLLLCHRLGHLVPRSRNCADPAMW
jgi:hypothetical protein